MLKDFNWILEEFSANMGLQIRLPILELIGIYLQCLKSNEYKPSFSKTRYGQKKDLILTKI